MPQATGTRAGFVSHTMRHFICLIAFAVWWGHCAYAQQPAQNESPKEANSALPWLKLEALSATRERPLFAPDRRKPSPPPVARAAPNPAESAVKVQVQQKPQLQLTGIVVSPAQTIVLLRNSVTSRSVKTHSGESVGPWRVLVDSNYTVILKNGRRAFKLEMFAEPNSRMRAMP